MAYSTMITSNERTTTASRKFKVLNGDSFKRFPKTYYFPDPTTLVLKQAINSTLACLPFHGQNFIAQFWARTETGINSSVLTTTYQPAVIYGNNEEFQSYHEAFLQQKYYINPGRLVAFGLPGRVFLTCTPEQTQDVHHYPKDQRPRGRYAFYSRIWGSFCVPVIVDGRSVGVLEFVTDKLKDSYNDDIAVVRTALENAGLQTSIQFEHPLQNADLQTSIQVEHPRTTKTNCRKRVRRTRSLHFTKYRCLVPQFGHCKRVAFNNLKLKKGTFRNVCRDVEIYEWPWAHNTTRRASSAHGTQSNQTAASSETSSFATSDASDDISNLSELTDNLNVDFTEWSPEETKIAIASGPDTSDDISNLYEFIEIIIADSPEWSHEQTTIARVPSPETQNNRIAVGEDWIEKERARADFMQEFNDRSAPRMEEDIDMVDAFYDYNRWDKDQEQRFGLISC